MFKFALSIEIDTYGNKTLLFCSNLKKQNGNNFDIGCLDGLDD